MLGKKLVDGYCKQMQEYRDLPASDFANRKKLKDQAWEEFIAVVFLQNASHTRFSGMLLDFCKSYANNNDKYPKNLKTMVDIMRQQPETKKKSTASQSQKKEFETRKRISQQS